MARVTNAHSRGFAGTLIDRSDHHTRRHRAGKRPTACAGVEPPRRAGRPPVQRACTSGVRRRSTNLCQVRMRVSLLRRSRPGRMYQAVVQLLVLNWDVQPRAQRCSFIEALREVGRVRRRSSWAAGVTGKQPSPTLRAKAQRSAQTQQGRIHRAQRVGPSP
jgi:hypothetical protein